jgi:hypothetical protein
MTTAAAGTARASIRAAAHDPALAGARAALWTLIAATAVAGWGVQWDIQWHVMIGRDSFWIAPHVMTYAGVAACVLVSFGMLAWLTLAPGVAAGSALPTMRLFGLRGTRGFHLAAWGIALTVAAAPIDDLWHRLFGLDVTLWSPPHLLGILGSLLNTVGALLIAREVYPDHRLLRTLALVIVGAQLYGGFGIVLQPTFRLAYLHGGVAFHGHAMLGALLLPLALVTTARLSGVRWSPLALIAVVLAVNAAGAAIARTGFEILQPVSFIEEEIAKDPTSPIAVAQAIARKQGNTPGRPSGGGQILSLLPALLLVVIDARRRPRAATLVWAVAFFSLWAWRLAHSPAFGPLTPDAPATIAALGVTLVAATGSAAAACWLAVALEPSPPRAAR